MSIAPAGSGNSDPRADRPRAGSSIVMRWMALSGNSTGCATFLSPDRDMSRSDTSRWRRPVPALARSLADAS
jgi:hypothetical protein